MRILSALGAVALAALMAGGQPALAQWNNAPWQPRGGEQSFGMSNAYRQGILDQRLNGRPSGQVYRTPSGEFLILDRGPDNQVVLSGGGDIPVISPRRGSFTADGFGYGGRDGYRAPDRPGFTVAVGGGRLRSTSGAFYGGVAVGGIGVGGVRIGVAGGVSTYGDDVISVSQVNASAGVSSVDVWTTQLFQMGNGL